MNILNKILISIVFLAVCFSLVSINILPFYWVTSQAFYFRFLMIFAIPVFCILLFYGKNLKLKISAISVSLLSFLFVLFVVNIFGENPLLSFWGNLERMGGYFHLLLLFLFFLILSSPLLGERGHRNIFYTSLLSSIPVVVYAFLQWFSVLEIYFPSTDLRRVHSFFGNPSFLATYILLHIFILFFCYFRFSSQDRESFKIFLRNNKLFVFFRTLAFVIVFLSYILVLLMTGTRAAIIAFVLSLAFGAFLVLLCKLKLDFKKIFIFCSIVIILLASAAFFSLGFEKMIEPSTDISKPRTSYSRIFDYSLSERSSKNRLYMWEMAFSSFKERPLVGWGQESFESAMVKYYQPKMASLEHWIDRPHNIFWDVLNTSGLFGLVFFITFLISIFYSIWLFDNKFSVLERVILSSFLCAYLLNIFFLFETLEGYIPLFLVLSYISFHSSIRHIDFYKTKKLWKVFFVILFLCFSFYLFTNNLKALISSFYLFKGYNMEFNDTKKAVELYKKAISIDSFVQRESVLQSFFSNVPHYRNYLSQESVGEYESFVLDYVYNNFHKFAGDYKYYFVAGNVLGELGFYEESMDHLNTALKIFPLRERIKFIMNQFLIENGEYDKAFVIAKEVFDLNSDYWQNRSVYARSAIYVGKNDIADGLVKSVFGTGRLRDLDILKAYIKTEQYDKAINLVESSFSIKKAFEVDFYFILINAYYLKGDIDKAIENIDKLVEIYPVYSNSSEDIKNLIKKGEYIVSY